MALAIFKSFVASEKHDGGIITEKNEEEKGVGLHYKRFWGISALFKRLLPLITST
jgi:hypothetical protein